MAPAYCCKVNSNSAQLIMCALPCCSFFRFIQPLWSKTPFLASNGNHEYEESTDGQTYASYIARCGQALCSTTSQRRCPALCFSFQCCPACDLHKPTTSRYRLDVIMQEVTMSWSTCMWLSAPGWHKYLQHA